MTDQNTKLKITYSDVADFFLALGNETGETITNLKYKSLSIMRKLGIWLTLENHYLMKIFKLGCMAQ